MRYQVIANGEVEAYNRDVVRPVPRLRVERDGDYLCAVDALLTGPSLNEIKRQLGEETTGDAIRRALAHFVAEGIEEAVRNTVLPTEPTTDIQRIAVGKVGGDGINCVIDENRFIQFMREGSGANLVVEGDTLHSFDA